ncbi:uncharacterized protein RHIMIDRAFT_257298 [Rhizopus microsporus ATCC 52813]|uniref:S-adenosyl-L-methionine-dependent methyltransferase n=1 Tax=Rhizopus microsporus ATCC 52813 TaxID=1340429 RepID=A0A2G4SSE7_RHIZD|nr:uncharacterized protein RHIMIDRAFT_257298 [Rhizopus microsporus ATCC 52813]PHZ11316.1 hypothetical protein RHIMIDRAFT_257298 [Rhizopus microsporus ATCC 52813]
MTAEDLLNVIEEIKTKVLIHKKNQRESIDGILSKLEELIELSTHVYLDLNYTDIEQRDHCAVNFNDIRRANDITNSLLLKIVSSDITFDDDHDDERIERASRILAHMSGRGAAGSIVRKWHIPYLNPDGERKEWTIQLHEPCYIGNDIGFKTWGAAPLLAKRLVQENLIPHLSDSRVLELGTGTGMVGLVCDLLGAQQVHVTDYHPRVLENVAYNIQLNQSRATFSKLDFIEVANDQGKQETYDIVIASDLLYEMEHAKYLPIAVNKLVKNEFYFMIPLRDTHWEEVECFQTTMNSMPDLTLITTEDFKIDEELEGIVCYRYYHYARSHMIQ